MPVCACGRSYRGTTAGKCWQCIHFHPCQDCGKPTRGIRCIDCFQAAGHPMRPRTIKCLVCGRTGQGDICPHCAARRDQEMIAQSQPNPKEDKKA